MDGNDLFADRKAVLMAADAVYRAAYRRVLSRELGIAWDEPNAAGNSEIVGMLELLIRLFSKGRQAIEAELEQRAAAGLAVSAKVANWVAHKVRQAKHHEPIATLWARWMAEARDAGFDLAALERRLLGHRVRDLTEADVCNAFDRLAAAEGLTREASTFGTVQVIRGLGDTGRFGPDDLQPLARRFLEERCVRVATESKTGRGVWSTPELLALERRLVDHAQARQDEGGHVVPEGVVDAVVERYAAVGRPLGADQEAALRALCCDGAEVSLLRGRAGTGKTTTMDAVRTAYDLANHLLPPSQRLRLRGLAPTGIAAVQLAHGAQVPTVTVDRFLVDLDHGRDRLEAGDVVVDEANMLGSRKAAPLLAHARAVGATVIVLGDDQQLQSIPTGGRFRGLLTRLPFVELTENRRQLDELDRQAVELIRNGLPEQAMALYRDGGRVTLTRTVAEADQAQVQDWWASFSQGEDAVMLAFRRLEVDRLNDLAHAAMTEDGRLSGSALEVQGREFRAGDRVVCGLNRLHDLQVANGTKGQVVAVDVQAHTVTLRLDGDEGRQVALPAGYLRRRLGEGRRPLDYAYAITGHKSEGVGGPGVRTRRRPRSGVRLRGHDPGPPTGRRLPRRIPRPQPVGGGGGGRRPRAAS